MEDDTDMLETIQNNMKEGTMKENYQDIIDQEINYDEASERWAEAQLPHRARNVRRANRTGRVREKARLRKEREVRLSMIRAERRSKLCLKTNTVCVRPRAIWRARMDEIDAASQARHARCVAKSLLCKPAKGDTANVTRVCATTSTLPCKPVSTVAPNHPLPAKKEGRMAKLVLPGRSLSASPARTARFSRKPDYVAMPKTTLLLIDAANLMRSLPDGCSAMGIVSIAEQLHAQGFRANFFMEKRVYARAKSDLPTEDMAVFEKFCRGRHVSLVGWESDLSMLQIAEEVADSVIISTDKFRDYGKEYPSIVGSDRVKQFSVSNVDGRTMVSVVGLHRCLTISPATTADVA